MKRFIAVLFLLFLTAPVVAHAQDGATWTPLVPGLSYGMAPIEGKPFIALAAVRGDTLSEPIDIGFYVLASPVCKALENPIDGPATGPVGDVGLVEIDGKNYALDGYCDGGNLTLTPSFWINRQALLDSVRSDPVMAVQFKPGPMLHYRTAGFPKVLNDLGVSLPARRVASVPAAAPAATARPTSDKPCSKPVAEYPVQAIRQGHQGVVYVTLTVDANEHPTDIRVYKSSGFPELDASAVQAMANVVCNVPPGTEMGTPVTFSLRGSM